MTNLQVTENITKVSENQFFILEDEKLFIAEKISGKSDHFVAKVKRGHKWVIEKHYL